MKGRPDRIALFIDLENFVGFCLGLGLPIDLAPELTRLTELGKISVRRSFGDIYKMPLTSAKMHELRKMLQKNLIQHEDIPHMNEFKNAADIRLVVDALSTAYTNDGIDMVAVVAYDRDYLPLFAKLREIGKEVIGITGSRDNTHDMYVKACDYFFYHEVLCGSAPSMAAMEQGNEAKMIEGMVTAELSDDVHPTLAEESGGSAMTTGSGQSEAVQLLSDALQALEAQGATVHSGASVIQMMRRIRADFDLAGYGYDSFKHLCEHAAEAGRIKIEHNGVVFNLRLAGKISSTGEEIQGHSASVQGQEEACLQLKEWLEQKMRIELPSHEKREKIYGKLTEIIAAVDSQEGIRIIELSRKIKDELAGALSQPVCYKILYCLYRANCFACSPGQSPYDPVVHAISCSDEPVELDRRFVENNLRIYARECRTPLDAKEWSKVFFGSESQADQLQELVRYL